MSNVTNLADAYSWNISRIAEAFGFHRDTVRKRLNSAMVRPSGKKSGNDVYELADVGAALFAEQSVYSGDVSDPDKMGPKDRKDFYQSENERLKFEEKTSELMPSGVYQDAIYENLKKIVSAFDSLPDMIERRHSCSPEQIEDIISYLHECREQVYHAAMDYANETS